MASLPKLPSERRFGMTFAVVFAALAVYWFIRGRDQTTYIALFATSFAIGFIAVAIPRILSPLNKAWFHLGEFLGRIVSPIVLGIIFFGLLTPIAVVARLLGRDELHLKRRTVLSYWITRSPPGPSGESFKNQF
jgi:hypothetical protein